METTREEEETTTAAAAQQPRVFVLSDIHTDYKENLDWVRGLSDDAFQHDAVILGGDVSDKIEVLETTLRLFSGEYRPTQRPTAETRARKALHLKFLTPPMPCTLNLQPSSTLHGYPYTLYPVPYTLRPIPCALYPVPYTLCPIYTLRP